MSEWQPIETAPKDGTPILGYAPGWYDTPYVFCWQRGRWVMWFSDQWFSFKITHWQPLLTPLDTDLPDLSFLDGQEDFAPTPPSGTDEMRDDTESG